jgi:drug/metabolite transporter (DMT)-like permease
MRFIPATTANLIATLEPVMTAVWAYFFLSEMLAGSQLFGGLLILAGVILLRASEK